MVRVRVAQRRSSRTRFARQADRDSEVCECVVPVCIKTTRSLHMRVDPVKDRHSLLSQSHLPSLDASNSSHITNKISSFSFSSDGAALDHRPYP